MAAAGGYAIRQVTTPESSRQKEPVIPAYERVRAATRDLIEGLSEAEATLQSMADASPAKWHLAHTTWFFEAFVLLPFAAGYRAFDEHFGYLFNSYYESVGERLLRSQRGLITRPSLACVLDYRSYVDDAVQRLLASGPAPPVLDRVILGMNHEEQHQELLLTDILHLFAQNPLQPAYRAARVPGPPAPMATDRQWITLPGGIVAIGASASSFAFDCERPRHEVLLQPFRLASHPVLNEDWMTFIEDGGYATPSLWLSDGWERVQELHWARPLYWLRRDSEWWETTLRGLQPVDPVASVSQVSFFEAYAFARWAGNRLPTEFEWEHAAAEQAVSGNFADSGRLCPGRPGPASPFAALFGDVWEWTTSDFAPYPRFRPLANELGEYNGKFMNGQRVLRGGSCVTAAGHVRPTYRNYFPPEKRWQFSGLRLAADA